MKAIFITLLCLPIIGLGQQVDNIDLTNVPIEDVNGIQFIREIGPQPQSVEIELPVNSSSPPNMSTPYPIIFIHGLKGDWYSWYDFYGGFNSLPNNTPATGLNDWGWSYGGLLSFCLNSTGNPASSNVQAVCNINADITYIPSTLSPGDYYIINFDCGWDLDNTNCGTTNGFNNNKLSNQAAIILQGRALGEAIDNVLQTTGKDKVILVGHSMGGLAAREYLQNSTHWQGYTTHRVAKLITSGTPHAGSNTTGFGLPNGFADERSEAVRDLRSSYTSSGYAGAYLFGTPPITENDYYIQNNLSYTYYNVDVNCSGNENDSVFGRNTALYASSGGPLQIPGNLEYTSVVGYSLLMPWTDEVVSTSSADLSQTVTFPSGMFEKFDVNSFHWNLTEKDYVNFKAIDEPDNSSYAYKLDFGTTYMGHLTFQGDNFSSSNYDYDYYKFTLNQSTSISIITNNLPANTNSLVSLYDGNQNFITSANAASGGATISNYLNAGIYYVRISGNAYGNTVTGYFPWDKPYNYLINAYGCTDSTACNYNPNANINNGTCLYSTSNSSSIAACDSFPWSLDGNTYTTSGIYTNVSTNTNGCLHTETLILTINNSTASSSSVTSCDSYTWSLNGNTTTATASGIFTNVSTNTNGCVHTDTLILTINNSTSNSSSVTSCDSYTWSLNGNTYTTTGIHTDVSTNANGCVHTELLYLTINNTPLVQINQIAEDLHASVTGGIPTYTYLWNTGSTNSFVTPTTNGLYWCIVTDQNGCVSNTISYNVTWITTSINDMGIADLSIYPNPSEDLFNIEFSSLITQDLQIRIVNIIGEVVIRDNLQQFIGEYTKQIDLTNNAKGIYFLEIETHNGIINKKLILQ